MGMSTRVHGLVPPDAKYLAKLDAYLACERAGVSIPVELMDFFEGRPNADGMAISIKDAVSEFSDSNTATDGWIVDLSKLDPKVKKIRFVNSY